MTSLDEPKTEEIRMAGMKALVNELGPAGAIRFLQLFHKGSGDFTTDREAWLDTLDPEEFLQDLERLQAAGILITP